jgi:hypothetical protein
MRLSRSARAAAVRLGINYPFPWNAYGTYFGAGCPPGSRPELDAWLAGFEDNLARLREELGVEVVRLFLLCNAYNYGTLEAEKDGAPRLCLPSELHPRFVEHLDTACASARRRGVRLVLSLLDFKALGRPYRDNGCTGKVALATEPALRERFLEQTLGAFLPVTARYPDALEAWEVQNEPTWNLRRWTAPRSAAGGRTLSVAELDAFLSAALARIDAAGQPSSVGHRFARDLARHPTGSHRQFHYYPERWAGVTFVDRRLPPYAVTRAFVGEFGVAPAGQGQGALWPELGGRDAGSTEQRLLARLALLEERGYPLALLWPDGIDGRGGRRLPPGPDPLQLSQSAQAALRARWRGRAR